MATVLCIEDNHSMDRKDTSFHRYQVSSGIILSSKADPEFSGISFYLQEATDSTESFWQGLLSRMTYHVGGGGISRNCFSQSWRHYIAKSRPSDLGKGNLFRTACYCHGKQFSQMPAGAAQAQHGRHFELQSMLISLLMNRSDQARCD